MNDAHRSLRAARVAGLSLVLALAAAACDPSASTAVDAREEEMAAAATPPRPTTPTSPAPTPSPSPTPSPEPSPTPPPPDRTALVGRLREATASLPDDVDVSLVVLDPEGRVVFGIAPDRTLLPASTVKLVTGAAALSAFGADHRIETTVRHTGALVDGTVTGSLVLEGGGDPALTTDDYRRYVYVARPHSELEALATAVADAGVTTVAGGVVVAPDLFGDTPEAPGWKDAYVPLLEARRTYALTIDGSMDVEVQSPAPDVELEILPADDPRLTTAHRFDAALRTAGVSLGPESRLRAGALLRPGGVAVDELPVVATLPSPPLQELVRFAFERSDNHISDTLFRLVGAEAGARDWRASGRAVADAVEALGVDTTDLVLTDGSGLSREHEVSARHLADVDRVMRSGAMGEQWRDALAVAGQEGTLRRRLRGTVADGRFLGKTGTLDDVTAIAGTVEGPDGEPAYHVAAIANLPPSVGRWAAIVVFDDVIALLAEDAAGCVRITPEAAPDAPSPAPGEVVAGLSVSCPSPAPAADDPAVGGAAGETGTPPATGPGEASRAAGDEDGP